MDSCFQRKGNLPKTFSEVNEAWVDISGSVKRRHSAGLLRSCSIQFQNRIVRSSPIKGIDL